MLIGTKPTTRSDTFYLDSISKLIRIREHPKKLQMAKGYAGNTHIGIGTFSIFAIQYNIDISLMIQYLNSLTLSAAKSSA